MLCIYMYLSSTLREHHLYERLSSIKYARTPSLLSYIWGSLPILASINQSPPFTIRQRNACSYLYVRLNPITSHQQPPPANHTDSTRNTLATVVALAGLGLAALNVNSKADAAKKAQVAVGATGQSFALGGCERSGESSPPLYMCSG